MTMPETLEENEELNWLSSGLRLGRVKSLSEVGFGIIMIYDESRGELIDSGKFHVLFFTEDLNFDVKNFDWVVFEPEEASPDNQAKYRFQAAKDSVRPIRDLTELRQKLEEQIKIQYQNKKEKLKNVSNQIEQDRQDIERQKAELERKQRKLDDDCLEISDLEEKRQEIELYEDEVNESLERWGVEKIGDKKEEDEPPFSEFTTEHELINRITAYIAAQGYHFDRDDIVNFYTCLKTGAIVVLAGLSGTGKSSLIEWFAKAIDANFERISVKATWSDDIDLLGFYHQERKTYSSTPFLDAIVRANAAPDQLFFICLDEMNLSRVEYYFTEFLNVWEKKPQERKLRLYSENEWKVRKIKLERCKQAFQKGEITQEEFNLLERNVCCYRHELLIPKNIFICGTVNVDETTHPFSDKVLDRVQIIQFDQEKFHEVNHDNSIQRVHLNSDQFQAYCRKTDSIDLDNDWFDELNSRLKVGGFHFSYRVKEQIEAYCAYALASGLFDGFSENDIIDLQIAQKVLPKIQGVKSDRLEGMLQKLNKDFLVDRYPKSRTVVEKMQKILEQETAVNYWELFRYEV